jgi:hypothetical protein
MMGGEALADRSLTATATTTSIQKRGSPINEGNFFDEGTTNLDDHQGPA